MEMMMYQTYWLKMLVDWHHYVTLHHYVTMHLCCIVHWTLVMMSTWSIDSSIVNIFESSAGLNQKKKNV